MNEKKKLLIILGIITMIGILITTALFISISESTRKIEEIEKVIKSEKTRIIYLSRPTCYYCNLVEPITDSLKEEYDLEYYHINTDEFSKSQMKKILKIIGIDESTFGTPYIAIIKNGKIIGEQIGYTDENILFKLFQDNGFIEENASLNMNYLEDINSVWNDAESKLLLVGKSGDETSIKARNILRRLSKKNSIEINYFDTAKVESEIEYQELLNKLETSAEQLPILTIIKKGEIIEKTTQLTEKELEQFLKENNYIK